MGISLSERETIFRIADDETAWTVFTESPAMIRRLIRLKVPVIKDGGGIRAYVPKKMIRISSIRTRVFTKDAAFFERIEKMKEGRKRKMLEKSIENES
jgi:hypothetical protein